MSTRMRVPVSVLVMAAMLGLTLGVLAAPLAPAASAWTAADFPAVGHGTVRQWFPVHPDAADPIVDRDPVMAGDVAVWVHGGTSLVAHDISSGVEATIVSGDAVIGSPAASGHVVVWIDQADQQLRAVDISDLAAPAPIVLAVGASRKGKPDIDGDVIVWEDYRNSTPGTTDDPDIYGYDLTTATEFPVCVHATWQGNPAVSGPRIVWSDGRGYNGFPEIRLYDRGVGKQWVVVSRAGQRVPCDHPDMDGSRLTWWQSGELAPLWDHWNAVVAGATPTATSAAPLASGERDAGRSQLHGDTLAVMSTSPSWTRPLVFAQSVTGGWYEFLSGSAVPTSDPTIEADGPGTVVVWVDKGDSTGETTNQRGIAGARLAPLVLRRTPATAWTNKPTVELAFDPIPALFGIDEMMVAYTYYTASGSEGTSLPWEPFGLKTLTPTGADYGPIPDCVLRINVFVRASSGDPQHYTSPVMVAVGIDRVRPVPLAPSPAAVKKGSYVTLKYRVNDGQPCGEKTRSATLTIKTLGGKPMKTVSLGRRAVNRALGYRFRCTLPRGSYRFFISAVDAAGNAQGKLGSNRLTVK